MHWSQQTKHPVTLEEETRVPRWEQPSTRGGLARWFRPPRFQRGPCAGSDPRSPHRIAAGASEQVPCLNHVSLQMMPLPHLLKRNLTYLNCPKSFASSHISKDTGPSLGAPHPSPLPRLRGGSPPRHLGSRHPRLLAASTLGRLVTCTHELCPPSLWGPFPSPSPRWPLVLQDPALSGAPGAGPQDQPSWGTTLWALSTCVGGRGASRFQLDMLRARSGLVVANPGGFVSPVGRAGPSTHGPAQGPAFGFSPAASFCEIFSCFLEPFFFF